MQRAIEERWKVLWTRIQAQGDPSADYADLCRRYAEPHRAYHNLDHVSHCLEELDRARHLAHHPDAVELAIWYHDAVYATRSTHNEERSSELISALGRKAQLPTDLVERAVRHVLASKHREAPTEADVQLFTDVDLSILGQTWERFSEYEVQIRREYSWVPKLIYRKKRAAILESFLDRPRVYCTPFFQDQYEIPARENIKKSLEALG
jgi:predicted metal-dependent HD superfamily phosphohydrolase